jgi:hypothetical protein
MDESDAQACAAFSPCFDMRAARTPDTSGVAKDVPLQLAIPLLKTASG